MIADNVKNIVWHKRGCKELRGLERGRQWALEELASQKMPKVAWKRFLGWGLNLNAHTQKNKKRETA